MRKYTHNYDFFFILTNKSGMDKCVNVFGRGTVYASS